MSGKYIKKKKKRSLRPAVIVLLLALGLFAGLWFLASRDRDEMPLPDTTRPSEITGESAGIPENTGAPEEPPYTFQQEVEGITSFVLGPGLEITRYGKYIGAYMEDGSDEIVANVMMIQVSNTSDQPIQYAKITLTGPAGDATFVLTTLLPGQTIIVLEADRKPYSDQDVYTQAVLDNLAVFAEELSLYEDKILIQPLDGGFNITNISGEDINGQICIYFKDALGDMLYGGITYVARIDGLGADEIRQIMSSNFTADNSRIMFVQIIE